MGLINPALYEMEAQKASGIVDVTSGNNTVTYTQDGKTVTVQGFDAHSGLRPRFWGRNGQRRELRSPNWPRLRADPELRLSEPRAVPDDEARGEHHRRRLRSGG